MPAISKYQCLWRVGGGGFELYEAHVALLWSEDKSIAFLEQNERYYALVEKNRF